MTRTSHRWSPGFAAWSAPWFALSAVAAVGCGREAPEERAEPARAPVVADSIMHLATPSVVPWKVGLYTDSSYGTFQSEEAQLQTAGAACPLQLYLNYGDFKNFEGSPSPGQGIVDVDSLNQANIQLVLAFEPTNASFCTHASKTSSSSTRGCRLNDLGPNSPHASEVAAAYANIAALADALSLPLIVRFGSEMNADWDDWDLGYDYSDNTAANFVTAFQFAHHYITKNLHTGRVLFAFAPNNVSYDHSNFATDIRDFWPGTANVDIIGLDGYSTANSFDSDFDHQLTELEALGSTQPTMLAEFASSTSVGGRSAWLDGATKDLGNHPRLAYMNWFDSDKSHPYKLGDTDSTGKNLYAEFAKDLLNSARCPSPPVASVPQDAGPQCIADGQPSQSMGTDCCSQMYDAATNLCGAAACTPTGALCTGSGTGACCSKTASCQSDGVNNVCCFPKGTAPDMGDDTACCDGTGLDTQGNCL